MLASLAQPDLISFAGGFPDPRTFPRERAAALLAEFAAEGEASAFQYAPTRGLEGALDALAGRIEATQGRRPAEDELAITSGGIEALDLVAASFLDPGDVVVVEGPTYLGAIQSFRGFEAEVVAVPLDEDGLAVDELERRLAGGLGAEAPLHDPRPPEPGRREPLGRAAGGARRARAAHGFLVIEDVAYRELGFDGDAPPSLWSLAPGRRRPGGDDLEDVLPGRAARLGGRPGGGVGAARLGEADDRPVRGRARAAALRGVRAARLDRGAARRLARALPREVRAAARGPRAGAAGGRGLDAPARRLLLVADAAGRRRGRPGAPRGRGGRRHRPRARRSIRTAAAARTSASRSASSTRP